MGIKSVVLAFGLTVFGFSAAAQVVIATIPVGSAASLVAVDRASDLIYVSNAGDNTVSVIDGESNAVIETDAVSGYPQAVSANPTLDRIYIGSFSTADISVINGKTNKVTNVSMSSTPTITGLAANPTTGLVYGCNESKDVVVLNGNNNKVGPAVNIPNCGFGVGVNPQTNLIYFATFTPNVTVVNGSTNKVVQTFPLDLTGAVTVAVDAKSNRYGVVDTNAGKLEISNASNGKLLGTVTGLNRPFGAVFLPGGKQALVTEESGNDLAFIDATNYTVINRTTVGNFPLGLDYNPATHLAYVVNATDDTVSVVEIP